MGEGQGLVREAPVSHGRIAIYINLACWYVSFRSIRDFLVSTEVESKGNFFLYPIPIYATVDQGQVHSSKC